MSLSQLQLQQRPNWLSVIALAATTAVVIMFVQTKKKKQRRTIYLDFNATTPVDSRVYRVMIPFFQQDYGNPASTNHWAGRIPAAAVLAAREQVLQLLGCCCTTSSRAIPIKAIRFTSSGTEANNWAIALALENSNKKNNKNSQLPHIVTSNVEHPAISQYLQHLQSTGRCTVTYVPVQTDGRVSVDEFIRAIQRVQPVTCLVTLQYANNETGALQPVRQIAAYCRQHSILFHTDAAQAAGKVNMAFLYDGADMVTVVGHKMGASKGVGCLYVRPGCLEYDTNLVWGGGQEYGRRGGTENVACVAGFGQACALAAVEWPQRAVHMEFMRSLLLTLLIDGLGTDVVQPNGPADPACRLPNTLSVGLKHVNAHALLTTVGDRVAASAGAACHTTCGNSKQQPVSSILQAMAVPMEFAQGTIRLSVYHTTTRRDVHDAAVILIQAVQEQLLIKARRDGK